MRRISVLLCSLFAATTLLWLMAENGEHLKWAYFPIRHYMVQYSGVMAIAAMSVGMILATRLPILERLTGGLDRAYRLHKWLGISALALGVLHWFWAKGTKYMVQLEWLVRPGRGGQGRSHGTGDGSVISTFLHQNRDLAEIIGEWAFYLLVILIAVSLYKKIRYGSFVKTHKVMGVLYLLLVFHSVVLMRHSYWEAPLGWVLGGLMALGTLAAIYSLAGRIGQNKQLHGTVKQLDFFEHNQVLAIDIDTDQRWPGHQAGQFAFLHFEGEEPHPFSLTSAPTEQGIVSFEVKALGDFTQQLRQRINKGDAVSIEGPYGQFDFQDNQSHQLWIAGGIGIAAFKAQLQQIKQSGSRKPVTLFYSTQQPDERYIQQLQQLATDAGITLHIHDSVQQGLLTTEMICQYCRYWRDSSIWFCGPKRFADALKKGFAKQGISEQRFHSELFEFR
ncbi:ferredoxin reductase family protein [Corallincola spongiicola]|uniref:Ferric reductase n=1 Tax=Corallincola spongiicola TaxID=2520508 RepID=A0ABY1WP23_9GAMM|nr:ferric reductase-like transmembrane domain-containing protein [Corallincola spongiicola]TAA45826.1 ferric reductase [Corallincola spongiicola]